MFNRSFKKKKFNEIQAQFLYVFQKASCKQRVHAWEKKIDAHGTVKNLSMKLNSRAARSRLKKVRDEATIERVRQDLKTHQKGTLGIDHKSLV